MLIDRLRYFSPEGQEELRSFFTGLPSAWASPAFGGKSDPSAVSVTWATQVAINTSSSKRARPPPPRIAGIRAEEAGRNGGSL